MAEGKVLVLFALFQLFLAIHGQQLGDDGKYIIMKRVELYFGSLSFTLMSMSLQNGCDWPCHFHTFWSRSSDSQSTCLDYLIWIITCAVCVFMLHYRLSHICIFCSFMCWIANQTSRLIWVYRDTAVDWLSVSLSVSTNSTGWTESQSNTAVTCQEPKSDSQSVQ